jgi:HK97 family phage major capsid protein
MNNTQIVQTPTATADSGSGEEMGSLLADIRSGWSSISVLPAEFKSLQENTEKLSGDLREMRRGWLSRISPPGPRPKGQVSEGCARHLAAQFIAQCERSDKLEALASISAQRDSLINFARQTLQVSTRTALTLTDINLPVQFGSEIRELVSEFGVVRRLMAPYPIGMGTARPARMGARPAFGSIAMSTLIAEKSPTLSFASLESHKLGGIVRLPREIDEQSVVGMGQFLARYGAIEFARAEDTWGFLADGSNTYENVKGVVQVAKDSSNTLVLGAGKTKPSDATLNDFRALRALVNKAALSGRLSAYFLDSTWETRLPSFRSQTEPNIYQRFPDGTAVLDGYPIVWTDAMTPYGTAAAADQPLAVFGALSFWWMGEHGHPRIDPSEHVWFANDQLAVRFIEEIDFDYAAKDATVALLTAAA